ncbi:MAG: L-lactate permease [Candidatus Woesearchaeota archaeon]
MDVLLALIPIICIVILLLFFKKPLFAVAPFTYLITAVIALLVWQMTYAYFLAASTRGLLIAIDISIIILGALFFLQWLKSIGLLAQLEHVFTHLHPDKRVQAIILIWFLGSFIEGTAGFGTPAAIVAPLLVGLGFSPVLAVAMALVGNSAAVMFGAVGTPIRVGFESLQTEGVAQSAALINALPAMLVPLFIIGMITYYHKQHKQEFFDMVPFALWSGFCFVACTYAVTFLGQEFPSLLGPLLAAGIVIYTTKKEWFTPKRVWKFTSTTLKQTLPLSYVIMPYVFVIGFLFLGRFTLQAYPIELFGVLVHKINTFNPGFAFFVAALLYSIIFSHQLKHMTQSVQHVGHIIIKPFITILFITGLVQIMMHSVHNMSGKISMIATIGSIIQHQSIVFFAPAIGAFGSFLSGSSTVSNILFGALQQDTALGLGISVTLLLSLQLIGSAVGNMISLTNLVAAQATVHLQNQEATLLKLIAIPFLLYIVLAGLVGMIVHLLA